MTQPARPAPSAAGRDVIFAAVDELGQRGEYLEAIELVTRENRLRRRPRLDRLLVDLRRRAFAQLERTPGREVWPPDCADPFPGVENPPEIQAGELTTAVMAGGVVHHGCLIVRGLLSSDRAARFRSDIDRAFAACDVWLARGPREEFLPWFLPVRSAGRSVRRRRGVREAGAVWAADSPPTLFELIEVIDELGLRGMIGEYFGEPPAVAMNKLTLRRVPLDVHPAWHQDGSFLGDGVRSLNIWISLSACGPGSDVPALEIVPCRMPALADTGGADAFLKSSVSSATVAAIAVGTPPIRPRFEPGDALIFDELLLHRTSVSPGMTGERYAIESWFFAPSAFPPSYEPLVL